MHFCCSLHQVLEAGSKAGAKRGPKPKKLLAQDSQTTETDLTVCMKCCSLWKGNLCGHHGVYYAAASRLCAVSTVYFDLV